MRNYNKPQKMYLLAKANLETLQAQESELEQNYIKENNIVNLDGSIPRASWAIDDETTAEKAMDECSKLVEESGLWAEILKARDSLKEAEENLISFGLGLIPNKNKEERKILEKAVKEDYTTRLKVIDLTLKLDARTIKKAAH